MLRLFCLAGYWCIISAPFPFVPADHQCYLWSVRREETYMDNIDRLYEISRLLANAQPLETGGIYLSEQEVAAINSHLAQIYNALMEGDVDGECEDDEDDGR